MMLMRKKFNGELALDIKNAALVEGRDEVAQMFKQTIAGYVDLSNQQMGGAPTLIGEFGLAFDMNDKHAYKTGDFSMHELALSMYYDAMDANLVHTTLWNYTPDNSNRWGDNWNEEDLSIFSRDQQTDPSDINSGGRAIKGFSRPYVMRAGGQLNAMRFDWQSGVFTATILSREQSISEIYVPQLWYPHGIAVTITSGEWSLDGQILRWQHAPAEGYNHITITPNNG
jgi:hypothetical protein